jgi:DNA-binding transcriptional ArsR family regulator
MKSLDRTFAALSDPTRREILARLAGGELTVGELAKPFDISPPAISRHLKVLEQAALISNVRDGKNRRCKLNAAALKQATEWLNFYSRFWQGSLDRLEAHLKRNAKGKSKP